MRSLSFRLCAIASRNTGLKVRTAIKAGGFDPQGAGNHNRRLLVVR